MYFNYYLRFVWRRVDVILLMLVYRTFTTKFELNSTRLEGVLPANADTVRGTVRKTETFFSLGCQQIRRARKCVKSEKFDV